MREEEYIRCIMAGASDSTAVSNLGQVRSLRCYSSLSYMNEYMAVDSGGYFCVN